MIVGEPLGIHDRARVAGDVGAHCRELRGLGAPKLRRRCLESRRAWRIEQLLQKIDRLRCQHMRDEWYKPLRDDPRRSEGK